MAITSSWRKIRVRVKRGTSNESFPNTFDASSGVVGSALGAQHAAGRGLLDEEGTSNEDDDPDD